VIYKLYDDAHVQVSSIDCNLYAWVHLSSYHSFYTWSYNLFDYKMNKNPFQAINYKFSTCFLGLPGQACMPYYYDRKLDYN
jgi:hypothetical protein